MAEAVAGLVFEIDGVDGQTFGIDGKTHEVAWRELQRDKGIVFHKGNPSRSDIAPTAETAAGIFTCCGFAGFSPAHQSVS